MNTIYGDKYKRVKDNVEELRYIYENYPAEYKQLATNNIDDGTFYVQRTVRDAASSGTSALAICNRLLIRINNQIKEDPKLRDRLFGIEDMPIEDVQRKVAASLEHISLLNPDIVELIEQSIEYTKVMYDRAYLNVIR